MVKKNLLLKKELEFKNLELELVRKENNDLKNQINSLYPTIVEFKNKPSLPR